MVGSSETLAAGQISVHLKPDWTEKFQVCIQKQTEDKWQEPFVAEISTETVLKNGKDDYRIPFS